MNMSTMVLMMVKDNKEMRPLLLKIGVALAISAGLLYSHLKKRRTRHLNRSPPSLSPSSGECRNDLRRKMGLESEIRGILETSANADSGEFKDNEETSEQKVHTDPVLWFSPRSRSSGDFVMPEFNEFLLKESKAKVLTLKIESLLADKRRLEEQVADHSRVVAELQSEKAKVKLLKWKIKSDAKQNKDEKTEQRLKDLDIKLEELKKDNSRLQRENDDLSRRLESTKIMSTSTLEVPEIEALQETIRCLRQEKGDLAKENDQLQAKCCDDAKDRVYLKWVNACLRYELRNHQAPRGKTMARDLSKNLSPRSEEKAKQLVLEYANSEVMADGSLSSMDFKSEASESSDLTEVGKTDDSSTDTPSAMKMKKSRKAKFFRKVKKLVLHKGNDHSNQVSSVGSTPDSNNASRRREMASTDSFRTMSRRYGCSPLCSPCNSDISISSLDRFEARANDKMKKVTSPSKTSSRPDIQRLKIPKPRLPSRLLGHGRRNEKERV